MNIWIVLSCVIGYLLGSVPFALVIGKVFYKTDIRKAGSGNLGGGNAGRVLGKKAGLAVMTMDILKVTLALWIASLIHNNEINIVAAGLSAAIGHCYPIFARFKGGKAVATMYGFLFGLIIVCGYSPLLFVIPLVSFLTILYLTKIIAIASLGSAIVISIYLWISHGFSGIVVALLVFVLMIIWRHRANWKRIINGEENKIKWM